MSDPEITQKKAFYMGRVIVFSIFYFVVDLWLSSLNNEELIQNWGIGLIGMMIFTFLYCVDNVNLVLFKMNKINTFMIDFFLSWILSDSIDFMQTTWDLSLAILRMFGL